MFNFKAKKVIMDIICRHDRIGTKQNDKNATSRCKKKLKIVYSFHRLIEYSHDHNKDVNLSRHYEITNVFISSAYSG